MIASTSPALKSSPMMTSSYCVENVSESPGASSHTESSLSPNAMQSHSPVAIVTQTSPGANDGCGSLLHNVKVQNLQDINSTLSVSNVSVNELSQSQNFLYSNQNQTASANVYLPLQYNSSMRDIVKNENVAEQIVDHQMMSYHPLQVVTSESVLAGPQERNGLCNAAQNSVFASLSFLPGVTSHNIQAIDQAQNGILVNNGISTSATAYVGTNENMTPTLYVQTENGNYQAVPFPPDANNTNGNVGTASTQLVNVTMSPAYVTSNPVPATQNKASLHQERIKQKSAAGPYRTTEAQRNHGLQNGQLRIHNSQIIAT